METTTGISVFETDITKLGCFIDHHFGGGVYIKRTFIPVGVKLTQHSHKYDHLSVLAQGTVVVSINGRGRSVVAPAIVTIEAGKKHDVMAITDAVWLCIHATDEIDPNVIDQQTRIEP